MGRPASRGRWAVLRQRTGARADLLAVGLGNPGGDYEATRHNLGAESVKLLAHRHGSRLRRGRATRSLDGEARVGGRLLALAVPQTYVNESGVAVAALARRHGIEDVKRLVIIHDELDLPVGRVKVKLGGGTAGHNGLKSIKAHLHEDGFVRVRIGIGKPPGRQTGVDHVLRRPVKAEREQLNVSVQEAADAVELVLAEGPHAAMNRFNPSA